MKLKGIYTISIHAPSGAIYLNGGYSRFRIVEGDLCHYSTNRTTIELDADKTVILKNVKDLPIETILTTIRIFKASL